MSKKQSASKTTSNWRLVAKKELLDLWQGGRAMVFLILFSSLLGITSFLLATNSELKLLPPREMIFMILQISITVSLFISLLMAADSISGERERATLEGLLLVPASRRQLIFGKFIASMSIWPAAYLITTIHLAILSPNIAIFSTGFVWGGLLGSLLVIGFAAFGMVVSAIAKSNRSSLFTSLFVAVLFLLPTQFPGTAQTGFMGKLVKGINPMESVNHFLEKLLVNNRTFDEMASWLISPVLLAAITCLLLFVVVAPRLDLTGDKVRTWRPKRTHSLTLLLIFFALTAPAFSARAQSAAMDALLQIEISVETQEMKTSDSHDFTTTVTNNDNASSAPLVVAMNLVNLGDGDPVDPEDWSPVRTQAIEPLASGTSAESSWTINAILEGDYLAYMVVIPEPDGMETTSLPVASSGIHLTVRQFSPLNPGGVAPAAFGIPILLGVLLGVQNWLRRRKLDG